MALAKHTHKPILSWATRMKALTPLAVSTRFLLSGYLYCLALSLGPVLGVSQTYTQTIQTDKLVCNLKLWTQEDGIPQRTFEGGFQDSRGIVWLAWQNTLFRFDGRKMVRVWQNKDKLYDYHYSQFAEDQQHNIWWHRRHLYKPSTTIHIYAPREDRLYTLKEYLGEDANMLSQTDHLGMLSLNQTVYLNNPFAGRLWQYTDTLEQLISSPKQEDIPIKLFPAPNEYYWGLSSRSGVMLLDSNGKTMERYPQLNIKKHSFSLDQDFQLYRHFNTSGLQLVGIPDSLQHITLSGKGQHRLVNIHNDLFCPLPNTSIHLFKSDIGPLQVVRSNKILIGDLVAFLQERIPSLKLDLSDTPNSSIIQLDNGTILFSTSDRELVQLEITPNYFRTYLEGYNIRGLDIQGDKLYAVLSGLPSDICEVDLNNRSYRVTRKSEPKPNYYYNLFVEDNLALVTLGDGRLIQTTLDFKQTKTTFLTPGDTAITAVETKCIFPRPDSFIWYGCSKGLVETDQKTGQSRYLLENASVYWLHEYQADVEWAGTNRGIYNIPEDTFYLGDMPDGGAATVAHIYEQDPQNFWLSTHQGLIRWTPYTNDYDHYTEADGLISPFLHAIYPDQNGRLWISSNNGILSFDPETAKFTPYFKTDGLCSVEQNLISHTRGTDGRLYFGSINGINSFHPDSIPVASASVDDHFVVKKLTLYNANGATIRNMKYLDEANLPIVLSRACKQLSVDLIIPYFGFQRLNLEWRIPSQSKRWQRVSEDNQVFLLSLPYGKFDIELRAWLQKDKSIPVLATLSFEKAYPFYMYPSFWGAAVLLMAGVLFFLHRWRSKAMRSRNRELTAMVQQRTQELETQKDKILAQNQKLERVDATKNQLFNNISHELRSPLTLIQVAAERLSEGEQNAMAWTIKQQAQHVTQMIGDIMNLSKIELGMAKLKTKPVEWNSLLQQHFNMFKGLAECKQQAYQLHLSSNDPIYLQVDAEKMASILNNLIGNAIKYTPEGGRIEVHSQVGEAEIALLVKDTGPGILQNEQTDIFKRYFQGQASDGMAEPGYGIGLALCKEYTELMGGTIRVESTPQQGTSFIVKLPKTAATAPPARSQAAFAAETAAAPQRPSSPTAAGKDKPNILIVEDNKQILQLLNELLASDYQVRLTTNGQKAFEALMAQPDLYDLVISDIMMPAMDGYALLQKTRAHPKLGFIPFLMLTALTSDDDKLKALRLGVDAFVTKPFETLELKTRIRRLTDKQQLRRAYIKEQSAIAKLDTPSPAVEAEPERYDEAWLQKLEAIVRENLSRPEFKVTDLAFELHVSERTLRNYTKAYTGMPPSTYLQKARLDQALIYLREKKYKTVGEVAYTVGFKDTRYFSKLFKQTHGKAPSAYL